MREALLAIVAQWQDNWWSYIYSNCFFYVLPSLHDVLRLITITCGLIITLFNIYITIYICVLDFLI